MSALTPVFPRYGETTILVPSPEGDETYLFDGKGRHLETRSALTNALRFSFEYAPFSKRLAKVRDIHGQEVTITGSTIAAPGSAGDSYSLNADGYLETFTNPENKTYAMTYHAPGPPGTSVVFGEDPSSFGEELLATFQTPRGPTTTFTYDAWRRLSPAQLQNVLTHGGL